MTIFKKLRQALATTAFTAMAGVSFAAPATSFPNTSSQGSEACFAGPTNCIAVADDRSALSAINDIGGAFYALGVNGFLEFKITPYFFASPVLTIETTNNGGSGTINTAFPETADLIFLSSLGPQAVTIKLNNQRNVGDSVFSSDMSLAKAAILADTGTNQGGYWQIDLLFNGFDTLRIVDTTLTNDNVGYSLAYARTRSDGFDIDYLSFNKVPEPASLALIGFGLLGLVAASRRRKN